VSLDGVTKSENQPVNDESSIELQNHVPKTVSFLGEEPLDIELPDETKVNHNCLPVKDFGFPNGVEDDNSMSESRSSWTIVSAKALNHNDGAESMSSIKMQQEEVERNLKVLIQKKQKVLDRKQVEASKIETLDRNRDTLFQKASQCEFEISKLRSSEKIEHEECENLKNLLDECVESKAESANNLMAATQTGEAREKDLAKKEARIKELNAGIWSLDESIKKVAGKLAKNKSQADNLKLYIRDLSAKLERLKGSTSSPQVVWKVKDLLANCEGELLVSDSARTSLLSHHESLVEERKTQKARQTNLMEAVAGIRRIVVQTKTQSGTASKDLKQIEIQREWIEEELAARRAKLKNIKKSIEIYLNDIGEVRMALEELSQRKCTQIQAFMEIVRQEEDVCHEITILQKSNQILCEKLGVSEGQVKLDFHNAQDNGSFKSCIANVIRRDVDKKCKGTLAVSRIKLTFVSTSKKSKKYDLDIPLFHIISAKVEDLKIFTELTITLDPDIQWYRSGKLRFINEPDKLRMISKYLNSIEHEDRRTAKSLEKIISPRKSVLEPEIIGESSILKTGTFQKLLQTCPSKVILFPWKLKYSLAKHGSSMYAFYKRMEGCNITLMLLKDQRQMVFGAYLSEEWHSSKFPYGNADSFVFRISHGNVEVFKTSKQDKFYQFSCENIFVGVKDRSAIWLSNNFVKGKTSACPTYGSPPLIKVGEESVDFNVVSFELWTPSFDF